jgi:hypothetical protein
MDYQLARLADYGSGADVAADIEMPAHEEFHAILLLNLVTVYSIPDLGGWKIGEWVYCHRIFW